MKAAFRRKIKSVKFYFVISLQARDYENRRMR